MKEETRKEITKISKEFADAMLEGESIDGTSWLVVDPLSGFLNAAGYKNELHSIPNPKDKNEVVLVMTFECGDQFIPTGKDLESKFPGIDNYFWLPKTS